MKAYQYKKSRIEWLGEIPKHWKTKRLGALGLFSKGGGISRSELEDEGIPAILYGDIYTKYDIKTGHLINRISEKTAAKSTEIKNGDLLLSGSGETLEEIGKCVVYDKNEKAFAGGDIIIFQQKRCDSLFLSFCLNSKLAIYQKVISAKGDIVVHTYGSKIKNVYLPFPPIQEQKAIAEYLDTTCEKLDKVIEIKERQSEEIEVYLMSKITELITSGVGKNKFEKTNCLWIPEIKKGWKIQPLKRLLKEKLKYGANESAENEDRDEPRYIRITDFGDDGKLRESTFKSLPLEKAEPYFLKDGDVLFARSGATVGKTFIFKDYKGKACFAGYLIKAECDRSKLLPEFLYFFTKSKCYEEWKNLIFTQATIQNIGADKYQYLTIPVPSVEEQKQIIDSIDLLTKTVSNLKDKIQTQIQTLKSYRNSHIHECVTGKKQVISAP